MSNIRRNEAGMVSILVTMIMIIVITLIVVGFTQVTNRSSRQALDRQLSTQAFYAAESGINQAKAAIDAAADPSTLSQQSICTGSGAFEYGALTTLSSSTNVKVTCLLVNPINENIVINTSGGSSVATITSTNAAGAIPAPLATTLSFAWTSPDGVVPATVASSCNSDFAGGFPQDLTGNNCSYGVLRVDLIPATTAVNNAPTAASRTKTIFFAPASGAPAVTLGAAAGYISRSAVCNVSNCTASVNVSALGDSKFYARISTLYKSAPSVTIDGTNVNGSAYFRGIFKIDATGKAQDVVRRVQVRYNPSRTSSSPYAAMQAKAGVCKQLTVVSNAIVKNSTNCD